jgi:phosphoglycolate phosphatase-like HAD superfamily hydrolase
MAIITFDCDEVLAELVRSMLHRHDNTFLGIPLEWHEITDYYLENVPKIKEQNVSFATAKKIFDDAILDHDAINPVLGMPDIVRSLKQQWHELYVITARGDDLQEATIAWIEKHYPKMFSDIILANHYNENHRCKWDLCSYLWSQLMIEDTIHNAEKVSAQNVPVIMPEKPWNALYVATSPLIHKASDYKQIEQILIEKGFL